MKIIDSSQDQSTYVIPGTVREEFPPKRTLRPIITANGNNNNDNSNNNNNSNAHKTQQSDTNSRNTQNIILNAHPQDNEIVGTVNIKQDHLPNVNIPFSIENDQREPNSAKLNLGAIVALGAFGGFVFLAAVITAIVILVRR